MEEQKIKNLFHQDLFAYLNKHYRTTAILFQKECALQLPKRMTEEEMVDAYKDNLYSFWSKSGLEERRQKDGERTAVIEEEEKRQREEEEAKKKEEEEKKQKAKAWRMKILQREREQNITKMASEEELWKFREMKRKKEEKEEFTKLLEQQELIEIEEEGFEEIQVGDLVLELGLSNTDEVDIEFEETLGEEIEIESSTNVSSEEADTEELQFDLPEDEEDLLDDHGGEVDTSRLKQSLAMRKKKWAEKAQSMEQQISAQSFPSRARSSRVSFADKPGREEAAKKEEEEESKKEEEERKKEEERKRKEEEERKREEEERKRRG